MAEGPRTIVGLDLGQTTDPTACAAIQAAGRDDKNRPVWALPYLKRWTLGTMVKTDVFSRGVNWTEIILRAGSMPNDLNLRQLGHNAEVGAGSIAKQGSSVDRGYVKLCHAIGTLARRGLLEDQPFILVDVRRGLDRYAGEVSVRHWVSLS